MIEKIKDFLKSRNNLVVIVLAGILLMVIALPVENAKSGNGKSEEEKNSTSYLNVEEKEGEEKDTDDYVAALERKVEAILGEMEGAGEVKVMITLRSSTEKIVEKDESMSGSDTAEEDSQGGTRVVSSVDGSETTVYTSEGNISEPYVVKTLSPEVEGVVVIAGGAGNGKVSKNITDAIQVLFGIEAHRIKVIRMETQNRQE